MFEFALQSLTPMCLWDLLAKGAVIIAAISAGLVTIRLKPRPIYPSYQSYTYSTAIPNSYCRYMAQSTYPLHKHIHPWLRLGMHKGVTLDRIVLGFFLSGAQDPSLSYLKPYILKAAPTATSSLYYDSNLAYFDPQSSCLWNDTKVIMYLRVWSHPSIQSRAPEQPEPSPERLNAYRGEQLIIATSLMLVFTTILLGSRVYARKLTTARPGWDDILLWPSYVCVIGLAIINYLSIKFGGVGYHLDAAIARFPEMDIPSNWAKLIYAQDFCYIIGITCPRLSIMCLYLRILTHKNSRRACKVVITVLLSNAVALMITAQLQCIPLKAIWDSSVTDASCFNRALWFQLANLPNIVLDVTILVIPIPTIWKLKSSTSRRFGIWIAFLTGHIGLVASCVRTWAFFTTDSLRDPTWASIELLTWTVVEAAVYLCAACLTGLRPLLSHITSDIKTSSILKFVHGSRSHRVSDNESHSNSNNRTTTWPQQLSPTSNDYILGLEPLNNVQVSEKTQCSAPSTDIESGVDQFTETSGDTIRVRTDIDVSTEDPRKPVENYEPA